MNTVLSTIICFKHVYANQSKYYFFANMEPDIARCRPAL